MRSSWGSVRHISGDRWELRWWGKDPKTGEYRRMSKTHHGTRRTAEHALAELRVLHSDDAPAPSVSVVWREFCQKTGVRAHTLEMRRLAFSVLPWKEREVDSITALEVQQWLMSTDVAPSTVQRAVSVLREILDAAVLHGWIAANPLAVKLVMPKVEHREKVIMTYAQMVDLWPHGAWWEPAYLLQAFGAARVGESLAVVAGECSMIGGVFCAPIRGQVKHRAPGYVDYAKNDQSIRTCMVVGDAAQRLWELSRDGRTWLTDDGAGKWCSYPSLRNAWLALGDKPPMKQLRASCETWWRWDMGLASHVIERLMGHLPLSMGGVTARHYDSATDEQVARTLEGAYQRWTA